MKHEHTHPQRPLEPPANCLNGGCEYWPTCETCGHDRMESERRLWALRKFGLSRMKNGLYGLRIRRAEK